MLPNYGKFSHERDMSLGGVFLRPGRWFLLSFQLRIPSLPLFICRASGRADCADHHHQTGPYKKQEEEHEPAKPQPQCRCGSQAVVSA